MRIPIVALFLAGFAGVAFAERYPPIENKVVKTECGACHMAFQPQFLPARSWEAILANLPEHFGEDASVADEAIRTEIASYLVANAGDASGKPRGMIRGLSPDATPLRITELPRWIGEHNEEVSAKGWKRAGSKANCVACHRGADQGYYDDD